MLIDKPEKPYSHAESVRMRRIRGIAAIVLGLVVIAGGLCATYTLSGGWRHHSTVNTVIDFVVVFAAGAAAMSVFKMNISTSIGSMSTLQKWMLAASILEELRAEPDQMHDILTLFRQQNQKDPVLLSDNGPKEAKGGRSR